jgi:hypothetical protein
MVLYRRPGAIVNVTDIIAVSAMVNVSPSCGR